MQVTCSIGAVLGQIDEQGRECVCEYFGPALRKHENNYSVSEIELLSVVEAATRFRVYLASQKFKIIVDHKALMSMTSIKSPTSPRLQHWALFMSQFIYEIVYKKWRLHSNADGLSRMSYEPTGASTPTVTDALMDDNFVNVVDLEMRESEFNGWLIQLSNENKASYKFGCELLHYRAAIEVDDGKLNMTDLPRQPSGCCLVPTGCPVDETGSNECEAISVTTEVRRTVSDVSWQNPHWWLVES